MVIDAVLNLKDRNGASIPSIRKYILDNNLKAKEAAPASFNNMTMKALKRAVESGRLERTKSSYRISFEELNRMKQREKERKSIGTIVKSQDGKSSRKSGGRGSGGQRFGPIPRNLDEDDIFTGTAAESNRKLRELLVESRTNRDKYLNDRMHLIKPFLTEKNYFTRR